MGLKVYNEKRNFNQTPEPEGQEKAHSGKLHFVVQRHLSSKLHYDFRLEMDGVLKSWAVPKGPSLDPADKRLAMRVEDHPLAYRTFAGDIPEGNYGAGHVDIWDEGTYYAAGTDNQEEGEALLLQELEEGHLKFVLEGRKLQGEFTLIKMKGRQDGAWLLFKKIDEAAVEGYNSEDHLEGITLLAPTKPANKTEIVGSKAKSRKPAGKSQPSAGAAEMPHKMSSDTNKTERKIEGQVVLLSSLDKFYWPDEGITKGDLIDYYQSIADVLMPYLQDRPQSLFRFPNGITKPGFIQKDVPHTPEWVRTIKLKAESTGVEVEYLVCDNAATLAYMNNLGCIQLNPWNSRTASLEKPDYLVIDLDPGQNTYDEVVEVALVTKEILDKAGARAFAKTSGATGMHIFVPLGALYGFDQARQFAHVVAQEVHKKLPKLTSLERSPKERRDKVYLDFLQNSIGQTIASAYTVRPMPGATVSTPLVWEEVKPGLSPSDFTIKNIPARLRQIGDVFHGVLGKGVDLVQCLKNLQ
ncbi:non-homologous end-joining DNA ligase [Pontibacter sp. 172403-2]|uniref:non-homologous end-joining DNA ligase n=1 Tax=Pontibacter rufus TaxID=2791028 RepID=UPI0018B0050A|nr:non-homologous end-joining DNA ligase [Pontibacter sp. 172403-2]MBF9254039.1 non-homologous end-joining DNA ligase [Pontibacter sp. 172403-2]